MSVLAGNSSPILPILLTPCIAAEVLCPSSRENGPEYYPSVRPRQIQANRRIPFGFTRRAKASGRTTPREVPIVLAEFRQEYIEGPAGGS